MLAQSPGRFSATFSIGRAPVIRAWWGYAAFIVAGLAVTAHDRVASVPMRWEDLEVPIMIALPFAFFQVWRDEHRKHELAESQREEATAQLQDRTSELISTRTELDSIRRDLDQERERNKPNLQGTIERIIGGPFISGGVSLTLTMTVRNPPPGAESVAETFRVLVTRPGHTTEEIVPQHFPDGWKLSGVLSDGSTWSDTLAEADAIYNKAKEPPIQRGGSRTGHLIALIPNLGVNELQGVSVQVRFCDVCGTPVLTPPWVIVAFAPSEDVARSTAPVRYRFAERRNVGRQSLAFRDDDD